MTQATLTVQVAFTKGITETADDGDFTTISTDNPVRDLQIVRGRSNELAVNQAGRATILCSNSNGKLDPEATGSGSPYYDATTGTNVLPMRHIRVKATDPATSTAYVIFRGFVERWVQEYPVQKDQVVRIEAVDCFRAISGTLCDGSTEAEQNTGTRVANLLDQAAWPSGAGYRSIDTSGNEDSPQKTYANTENVLAAIQDIEAAEIGSFFASRAGVMTFKNRTNRISAFATIAGTFSDTSTSGGRVTYHGLDLILDDSKVVNIVNTKLADGSTTGTEQTDSASQTLYGVRSLTKTGLMLVASGDATAWAQYQIGRLADPATRVQRISLIPPAQDALWAITLPAELGNAYIVERTPAAGNAISRTVICERITHRASGQKWLTTLEMSPADTAGYWVLDDGSGTFAAFSKLGDTTRLFYG